jgi:hypothetical protein
VNTDEKPEDYNKEAGDKYLNVEIIMNSMCTNDADEWLNVRGNCTANPGANPLFDTHEYEIEFTDRTGNQISPFTGSHGPQKRQQRSPEIGRDGSWRKRTGKA